MNAELEDDSGVACDTRSRELDKFPGRSLKGGSLYKKQVPYCVETPRGRTLHSPEFNTFTPPWPSGKTSNLNSYSYNLNNTIENHDQLDDRHILLVQLLKQQYRKRAPKPAVILQDFRVQYVLSVLALLYIQNLPVATNLFLSQN
ncbi:hypothetical protein EYC84_004742 [Monilinia fructicola]|uniref:Uncharacterized protein n=1 Tax=Monilinia fructicola TaxID=38448 RepID=A0A5M9K9P6_MONFR|nr:hypothetical protein EYC84_004742 [Monilinia fructicola]